MDDHFFSSLLETAARFMAAGGKVGDLPKQLAPIIIDAKVLLDPASDAHFLACQIGRNIWRSMPNPTQDFATAKQIPLGRNDNCISGLNCKFKQCCGQMPDMPPLSAAACWAAVCVAVPTQAEAALKSRHLPDSMLAGVARLLLDANMAPVLIKTLPARMNAALKLKVSDSKAEHIAEVLLLLCDAHDAMGDRAAKLDALHLATQSAALPLKSNAWQRLATIAADTGDLKWAWECFSLAQRANPDDLSLAHLEVVLLSNEGREAEAQSRARFWLAKIERQQRSNKDFGGTLREFLQKIIDGENAFDVVDELSDDSASLQRRQFFAVMSQGLATPIDTKLIEFRRLPAMPREPTGPLAHDTREETMIMPTAGLAKIEREWAQLWPFDKPVSTQALPDVEDTSILWQPDFAQRWLGFLTANQAAFSSFEILDDLLAALSFIDVPAAFNKVVQLEEQLNARAVLMLQPLCERNALLQWGIIENRAALRLATEHFFETLADDLPAKLALAHQLLRLNPNDNHGIRLWVIQMALTHNQDSVALSIIHQYGDDQTSEIRIGEVLALYKLDRKPEALKALKEVMKSYSNHIKWLIPARKAAPKDLASQRFVAVDSEYAAWNYREEMREVWVAAGALTWLKANAV